MKIVAKIIMVILFLFYLVLTLGYFSEFWGGLGFFGALVTVPLSIAIFILLTTVTNWVAMIMNVILVSLFFTLWSYVSGE